MSRLIAIGAVNPPDTFTQAELIELFGVTNHKIRRLYENSHIAKRHLCLPEPMGPGQMPEESPAELYEKHRSNALRFGEAAINEALATAGLTPRDVDYIACVSSTGFLCPSLTAHYIKDLGFRPNIHRIDLVGMGCNGGLNGMQPVVNYCTLHPGKVGLLVCVEICSASYVFDGTMRTAVVNSLFGDGAAAAVFATEPDFAPGHGPRLLGFESHIVPEEIGAMRFDFDGRHNSFFLSKTIPYALGSNVEIPVGALLGRFGLKRRDVKHWILHSGGRKVIDAIKYALDLTAHDVRHTESVLEEYGNLSSASFLFSQQRLLADGSARPGDRVVLMTMGPGTTIETCLGEF